MTKLRPDTTFLLTIFALVVAGVAQASLQGTTGVLGAVLYVIAAGLLVFAVRRYSVAILGEDRIGDNPESKRRKRTVAPALCGLSVIVSLSAVALFGSDATMPVAWALYIMSVLLFVASFVRLPAARRSARKDGAPPLRRFLPSVPFVGVFAVAIFVRLWQLADFPFGVWYDEAVNGLVARQIITAAQYRPLYVPATQMPAHFNYLVAASFLLFGSTDWAVRVVSAAFGVASVVFGYLLFRRWFGAAIGVFAALMLAVMRYSLTFSRLGMNGISTPAFELAALYFLDRALAGKKPADFAWLGITIGFGLGFYLAFRLFIVVLLIFTVILLAAASARYGIRNAARRYGRGLSTQWVMAALGILITFAPVAQFAVRHPDAFFSRSNTVSIFEKRDEPNLGKALVSNTLKHLEMFNFRGDGNGRHNLPGSPMLDPIMGTLFVLGMAYSLWRWRDPANLLMLLVFFGMLLAGILSLDFEAPQAYRSIGVIPALAYFVTVPVAAATHAANRLFERKHAPSSWQLPDLIWRIRSQIWLGIVVVAAAAAALVNLNMFFGKQQYDASAWAAYSTPETLVARAVNQDAAHYDFLVSALYFDPPTVKFLQDPKARVDRWVETDRLPLIRDDDGRGVIMLLDPNLVSAFHEAQRIYPEAEFTEFHPPTGSATVLYKAKISVDALRAAQGVEASYFSGETAAGAPAREQTLSAVAVDWSTGEPIAEPFVAEFRSTLAVPKYGPYIFTFQGDAEAQLWIDEFPVTLGSPITLARGNHALRIEMRGGQVKTDLWWQPPDAQSAQPLPAKYLFRPSVPNSGLLGSYYPTADWTGAPAFTQIDPALEYYFHIIPLPRPYSVEWSGKLFAPSSGDYQFELYSVDGSELIIDNGQTLDNPHGRTTVKNTVSLTQGWHDIDIRFSDRTSGTQIYFYWTPPGGQREIVPSRYLSPPRGTYPVSP